MSSGYLFRALGLKEFLVLYRVLARPDPPGTPCAAPNIRPPRVLCLNPVGRNYGVLGQHRLLPASSQLCRCCCLWQVPRISYLSYGDPAHSGRETRSKYPHHFKLLPIDELAIADTHFPPSHPGMAWSRREEADGFDMTLTWPSFSILECGELKNSSGWSGIAAIPLVSHVS
jgi:hypothetical protein